MKWRALRSAFGNFKANASAERRQRFWVNEAAPTFLDAEPPAKKGEPRFEVEFGIDGNKRLLVTARDLLTKQIVLKEYPVVKLS